MPALKTLLIDNTRKPRQSWRQQLDVFSKYAMAHNAAWEKRQKMQEMIDGR